MTNHVQNHIHLSNALGTAPENAPTYSWKVHDRQMIPLIALSVRRSKTFKLYPNVLRDGSGNVVNLTNFTYQIRVQGSDADNTQSLIALLKGWLGGKVYLVDNFHPDDGSDHTSAVRTMLLSQIQTFKTDDWGLFRYYVNLELEDWSI